MRTELGRIAGLLQDQDEGRTPLTEAALLVSVRSCYAVLAICVVAFLAGLLQGEPPLLMLSHGLSLAVAAMPEALPAVVTISLALAPRSWSSSRR
ncbi:MAG: hypothetical protein U5R30_16050 [Deltaproteobacteria bacterium]|nr:hypothetical protein [Deltaproteobacteria bacterium]